MSSRRRAGAPPAARPATAGSEARALAARALERIEADGAYANLLLPTLLERSHLAERDRHFVTELVYGTTRMRRACDALVDRFLSTPPALPTRVVLRLGAYQLAFLGTPPHAAVDATVAIAPPRTRGLVNAILRRVASTPMVWPDDATRLSYPDWVVELLVDELGPGDGLEALGAMDQAASATARPDGYVQDQASQWVAELVGAQPGERVADVCAAPGGKASWMAGRGAHVVAGDVGVGRARLVQGNARRLGAEGLSVVAADATMPPFAPATFDRALVDAPCSGLGALRRRPDARWRVRPDDVGTLAALAGRIVEATAHLVRPGGELVYSVCTLTRAETIGVDEAVAAARPDLEALPPPGDPWRPHGRGALLLPQDAGTDGMFVVRYRRRP